MRIIRLEFQIDSTGNCILCESRRSTTVDRTLPYRVQNELSRILLELGQSWTTFDDFCDHIDEALLPLEDLKRRNVRTSCILVGVAFAFIASYFIIQALSKSTSNKEASFMSSMMCGAPYSIILSVFISIPFIGICFIIHNTKKGEMKIFSRISELCDQISSDNSGQVKFTLRYQNDEKHSRIVKYIEVKIIDSSESLLETGQRRQGMRMMMGPNRPGTPETVFSCESSDSEDDS